MSIGTLLNIGDVLQVNTNFIEQLSAITAVGESMAGVSLTRTYTAEFRHSTDNSTWTAWATWNLANAQAITYDPDDKNYFQHRFTRTGSDATGALELYAIILQYTRDPNAISGHGAFTDIGMIHEVGEFLAAIIQTRVPETTNGKPKFKVLQFEERQTSGASLPLVLVSNVRIGGQAYDLVRQGNWPITCDLLVKMQGATKGTPGVSKTDYSQMIGTLMTMFRHNQNEGYRYSFTFKGTDFVNIALSDLGAADFRIEQVGVVHDRPTDTTYMQLELRFTIFADRKIQGITYS